MKRIASLLLAGAILVCTGSAQTSLKLSTDLLAAVSNSTSAQIRVVVLWQANASNTAQIIADLGGTLLSEFPNVRGGAYLMPTSALEALSNNSNVRYVSIDRKVTRKLANAAAAIGAPSVWKAGFNGAGIGVAVIDSGMNADYNLSYGKGGPVYSEDFTGQFSNANPGLLKVLAACYLLRTTRPTGTVMASTSAASSLRTAFRPVV